MQGALLCTSQVDERGRGQAKLKLESRAQFWDKFTTTHLDHVGLLGSRGRRERADPVRLQK